MNIRKRILIPMILLTVVSGIAVLISSILLFTREVDHAMNEKIDVAAMVVENEIDRMKETAYLAVVGMANNPDLAEAIVNVDRHRVLYIANNLKAMTGLDYCMIFDTTGTIIVRTHEPELYGDNHGHMPHIRSALDGMTTAYIVQGQTIRLGASAGTPVLDSDNNIVGAVSLGFMLDKQEFLDNLKYLTGCEVAIFRDSERIATTLLNDDGSYALGIHAEDRISEHVLAGGIYTGRTQVLGKGAITKYTPIYGANDETVGMIGIIHYTAGETGRLVFFIVLGVIITLAVLVVCFFLARFISGIIEQRLEGMMQELKEREAELARTNDANEVQLVMLNSVIKASRIALWDMDVLDNDPLNPYNIYNWTDEFLQMLGYTDESEFPSLLNSWSTLLHPEDKDKSTEAFRKHLLDKTGQTPFDVEYRLLAKNGEYIHIRETGETIRDAEGNIIRAAGALTEITETKKIMAEMKKKQAEAESANRTKSVFLANMSHEIRTPMNSIIGFSELAQYGDLPQKTREYLDNIQDSAKWLLKIINDILDISKIESGKIILESIPFDLPDIFEHCQASIIPKTKEKGIMLYCYAEPSVGKKLLGDPVRVRQVLTNLLSNAVKFTNIGTVKLLASVISRDDNRITIGFEIKDSGIGMTKEQIDKIFEPFTQADESVTRRFGGTGLGLTITKNIIELMGGKLNVESTVGVGSRFSFSLTFEMIDDTFGDRFTKNIIVNEFERPQFMGEVLVCEDNSLNQQVICDHLARVGLKTVVAHNGKEGVDIVAERIRRDAKPFDLIFMDIHMPVMDGLDAATQIAAMGVNTPIVALTANVMSNDLELYKISGMADTVGKPFTTQELWRCLVKYIPVDSYTTIDQTHQSTEEDIMLKKLKLNFVKTNQNTFDEFVKALKEGDSKQAHRLAHTIKGNAGQIGEKRLQNAAAIAENTLTEGISLITKEHIHALETEMRVVLDGLAPLLEEANNAIDTEPVDIKKVLDILDKLVPLLEDLDTDCLNIIEDLKGVSAARELIDQIEGYQYESALITLENLRKELMADYE